MLVIEGQITFGMLIAVQYIIGQLKGPVSEVVRFISSYQLAMISYIRMAEVDRTEEEETDEIASNTFFPTERKITLKNVSFRYSGNSGYVVKNVDFTIPEGKVTAIVGSSGSGKSTLIKILLRLYNSLNVSLSKWREKIGVVTQDSEVFKDTILNNIVLGKGDYEKDRFLKAVSVANIKDEIEKLPLGYNTLMGENGRGLSEGQKQRVLIARAIYKNPDFLFFDEATNALDATNESLIQNTISKLGKNNIVIQISHIPSSIRKADKRENGYSCCS